MANLKHFGQRLRLDFAVFAVGDGLVHDNQDVLKLRLRKQIALGSDSFVDIFQVRVPGQKVDTVVE